MSVYVNAFSPKGDEIIGTYELVPGAASVQFTRGDDGKVDFEHDGSGTKMFWDAMLTQKREGKTIFLCRAGEEWTQDQLTFKDEGE